jgi:putative transcriptional regulator
MTSIKHHLTDDLIFAYSAGMLPEAVNLIVASHISMCDACRAAVETYDALGGSVLETSETVEVSDACLDNALALIRGTAPEERPIKRKSKPDSRVPQPLRDYIGGTLDDVAWRPVGMGMKQAILPTSQDASARLLYIPAGMAMPDHGHKGMELTLVLQGAFSDADGRYARGDIEVVDAEVDHKPVADPSEDCICLAVTDAPLRFNSLLPRLAQPFFRI